jgi:hypothetical protein
MVLVLANSFAICRLSQRDRPEIVLAKNTRVRESLVLLVSKANHHHPDNVRHVLRTCGRHIGHGGFSQRARCGRASFCL